MLRPWTNVNLRLARDIGERFFLALRVRNAMNSHQALIKNNYYPFDYRRETRRAEVQFGGEF